MFDEREKLIDDHALVALTIMIAESKPEEKRDDDQCDYELFEYHTVMSKFANEIFEQFEVC